MEFARIASAPTDSAHPVLVTEFLRELTQGAKRWGTVDVSSAGRSMWHRDRITVYPPGTTSGERRALHFARNWPIAGAVLALLVMVMLSGVWPPLVVVVCAAALYLAGFLLAAWLTRRLRSRVRSLSAVSMYIHGELEVEGDLSLVRETAAAFAALDARQRAGEVDPVQYETEWARIYETLPNSRLAVRS